VVVPPPVTSATEEPVRPRSRRGQRIGLILAVAVAVRGALFLLAGADERRFYTLDAGGYLELARHLSAGYLEPRSQLFAMGLMRTPGYPLFAAAVLKVASSVRALIFVQLVLSVATVWLCHRLGTRLMGPAAGEVAALILSLDPVSAIYANQLQPETLFTALVVGGVLTWVSALDTNAPPAAALSGLLLGLAVLTRPIGAYLALVLLAWGLRRLRIRVALAFLAPLTILVGGWIVRNDRATGVPMLTTIQGINLLEYRAAGALASESGIDVDEARRTLRVALWSRLPPHANAAEVSRVRTHLALEVMSAHPRGVVAGFLDGAWRLLTGSGLTALSRLLGDDDPESLDAGWKRTTAAALAFELAVVYGCASWGLLVLTRMGRWTTGALLLGVIGYFVLISAGPEANTRFRFPAMPFIALLAGIGVSARNRRAAPPPPVPATP